MFYKIISNMLKVFFTNRFLCKNISTLKISLLYLLYAVVLVSAISVSIHHKKDRFFFLKTEKGERIEEDEQTAES